jgi:hypothetical protein
LRPAPECAVQMTWPHRFSRERDAYLKELQAENSSLLMICTGADSGTRRCQRM